MINNAAVNYTAFDSFNIKPKNYNQHTEILINDVRMFMFYADNI